MLTFTKISVFFIYSGTALPHKMSFQSVLILSTKYFSFKLQNIVRLKFENVTKEKNQFSHSSGITDISVSELNYIYHTQQRGLFQINVSFHLVQKYARVKVKSSGEAAHSCLFGVIKRPVFMQFF